MCYYERFEHACGCWKWGNFRQHCQKEHRIGETCGLKLSLGQATLTGQRCANCEKMDRKLRRLEKTRSDMRRWYGDPTRKSSFEKASREEAELLEEIRVITADIERRRQNIGRSR